MNSSQESIAANLVQKCYELIENSIVQGTFEPGKKLKIKELKEITECGHNPIREALSRLTTTGLVTTKENRGFYVKEISEEDIKDVYNTFLTIETLALTQAMIHGDDAWKTTIVATLYNLSLIETAPKAPSLELWIQKNYEFHYALIAGCNSPMLLQLRTHIYRAFDRYCRLSFTINSTQLCLNYKHHEELAHAVLERNSTVAIKLMTEHILKPLENIISSFKKQSLL